MTDEKIIGWEKYDLGKYIRKYLDGYGDAYNVKIFNRTFHLSDFLDIKNTLDSLINESTNVKTFASNATNIDISSELNEQDESTFQKAKKAISRGTIVTGVAFGKLCLKIVGTSLRIGGNVVSSVGKHAELLSLGLINVIPGLSRDVKDHEKIAFTDNENYAHSNIHLGLKNLKRPAERLRDKITGVNNKSRTSRITSVGYHLSNAGVALQKLSNQTWVPDKPRTKGGRDFQP